MMGIMISASISSLENDGISTVDYTWSQSSGPTISNLGSIVGYLDRPTFYVPGRFNQLSFNNGLTAGNTYGFSLTAKVSTPSSTETFTTSTTVDIQQNPVLTFTLQDATTNQPITSGIAGTTVFKLTITGNSNPYSDSGFTYGFGFADSDSITILTDMISTPATFTLPFISGQNSIDIYVACEGTKSRSIQKLTTVSLSNPVSNLTPSQAIDTISNLVNSGSSVGDLLGAASLLNTVSTSDSSQISSKSNIRNTIITSLTSVISTTELGPAFKALSAVTANSAELTQTSANNAFDALIGSTVNSQFSRNDVQSVVNIASNALLLTSNSKPTLLATSLGGKLTPTLSYGDVATANSNNFDLAVMKGAASFSMGNVSVSLPSTQRFLGCFFLDGAERSACLFSACLYARTTPLYIGQRSISQTYTIGSKVYDIVPLYENGTAVVNASINGYVKVTIPYSDSLTPVCGLYDSVTRTVSVDPTIITTKQSGSVLCQTKNLNGNVLLLSTSTTSTSTSTIPKESTQVNESGTLGKCLYGFMLLVVLFLV